MLVLFLFEFFLCVVFKPLSRVAGPMLYQQEVFFSSSYSCELSSSLGSVGLWRSAIT